MSRRAKAGLYNSASDVVREALRIIEARIEEGLASLDRGEGVDVERFTAALLKGIPAKDGGRKKG